MKNFSMFCLVLGMVCCVPSQSKASFEDEWKKWKKACSWDVDANVNGSSLQIAGIQNGELQAAMIAPGMYVSINLFDRAMLMHISHDHLVILGSVVVISSAVLCSYLLYKQGKKLFAKKSSSNKVDSSKTK